MSLRHVLGWCAALLTCAYARGAFHPGELVRADGKPIDLQVGHCVPSVADFNGDGKKDLVVGYFAAGKIRLYLNTGTNAEPKLSDAGDLSAAGTPISLPSG